jgi:hypothetical protein
MEKFIPLPKYADYCVNAAIRFGNSNLSNIHHDFAYKNPDHKTFLDRLAIKRIENSNSSPYVCPFCETFKNLEIEEINNHIIKIHLAEPKYNCIICNCNLQSDMQTRTHVLLHHTNIKPYRCDSCEKRYKRKFRLVEHTNKVHPDTKKLTHIPCINCCEKIDQSLISVHREQCFKNQGYAEVRKSLSDDLRLEALVESCKQKRKHDQTNDPDHSDMLSCENIQKKAKISENEQPRRLPV